MTKTQGKDVSRTAGNRAAGKLTAGRALAIPFGLLAAGSLAACGQIDIDFDVDGSGTSETISYDFDSFDEVDIGSAFEAEITIEPGTPSVEITMDDNLFEHLDVSVNNGRLKIEMDDGMYDTKVDPRVVISMPAITELDVSGATDTKLTGLDEETFTMDISGAANAKVDGSAARLTIDASGASSLEFDGSSDEIRLDASGASSVDLGDVPAETVEVDLSGASSTELGDVSEVSGEVSGAASLDVPDGANVSVSTSGAGSIDRT